MSKYVLPVQSFILHDEIAEPRQVFDTLEEAAAAYKSGLFGPMLEWKGPFNGPFPLCREWHGMSSAVVTGMGPFPPECIYEILVETIQEAERLYDVWQYMVEQAAEERARETVLMAPELSTREPYVVEGELIMTDDYKHEALNVRIDKVELLSDIADHFFDSWEEFDGGEPVSLGRVRITVELLEQP